MGWLIRLLAAAALALGVMAPSVASMRVDPMIISLSPTGAQSTATVQITNVTDIVLPVELTVTRRELQDGKEILVPADADFVMFPPQFTLQPGETQTVRLQWVGAQAPDRSQSYYIYATQVPVPLKPGQSGVVVNYRFGISVHIEPPGVSPGLQVVDIKPGQNAAGVDGFTLTVENTGSRYARMAEYSLDLETADGKAELSPEKLKDATGVGFMLPGERRDFFVPFDGSLGSVPTAHLQLRAPQG